MVWHKFGCNDSCSPGDFGWIQTFALWRVTFVDQIRCILVQISVFVNFHLAPLSCQMSTCHMLRFIYLTVKISLCLSYSTDQTSFVAGTRLLDHRSAFIREKKHKDSDFASLIIVSLFPLWLLNHELLQATGYSSAMLFDKGWLFVFLRGGGWCNVFDNRKWKVWEKRAPGPVVSASVIHFVLSASR